ncbi:glycosyltransferase [Allocatelliglobosispora scoriae]|nr:glycosyltransferase [Allocatelliglobosispora scoriae]
MLFTFAGGNGHADPLLPIARAAESAGHTVAVSGRPAVTPMIQAAGLTAIPTGDPPTGPPERSPLLAVDVEREDRVFRDHFAGRLARRRAELVGDLARRWRPDLIVCDETDFGSMIAAEVLGLPYASVLVISSGHFSRPELIGATLDGVRAGFGLAPDPELAMLSRHLVLSPVPPSFRDPAHPLPATAHSIRPVRREHTGSAPAWLDQLGPAPIVYATLGTEFNVESGDLFQRIIAGLTGLPITLIVTVGAQIDPAEFGPQPSHVRIERFIPQAALLPRCAAVVSHGGSGSVIGALTHGVPSVVFPMGADQPANADRCAALGVARVLEPVGATPAEIGAAVAAVLADPGYRAAAERLRDELAALPGPDHAVKLLEALL